ncbi:MAG: PrsW family glutamic-type intramembrane protease [Eubacteriales bacterium]|nr:PrsW family glutamic-type intramembrane protease [Eubacteriales bacterium]
MVTMNFILFLLISPPILLMTLLVERKARLLLVFMAFGIFSAYLSGQINSVISAYVEVSAFDLSIHVAPVVEEFLKAFPVVVFFFAFKPDSHYILGCAVCTGLGFAFFENAWAFSQSVSWYPTWQDVSFALSRGFGASMVHSICTLIIIYCLYICSKTRKLLITGTLASFSLICTIHSLFNVLIQSRYAAAPFILTIGIYAVLLWLSIKKKLSKKGEKKQ